MEMPTVSFRDGLAEGYFQLVPDVVEVAVELVVFALGSRPGTSIVTRSRQNGMFAVAVVTLIVRMYSLYGISCDDQKLTLFCGVVTFGASYGFIAGIPLQSHPIRLYLVTDSGA